MAQRSPRRPSGARRPTHQGHEKRVTLERSYAQKVRVDRQVAGVPYASKAERARYWAGVQAQAAAQVKEGVDSTSSMPPVTEVHLPSANVRQATLQSVSPAPPGSGISVAGLDQSGFVPPPPTGAV